MEISCCRAFWFEFSRFWFFLYICLQSQVFCFHTCMFGVVSFWSSVVSLADKFGFLSLFFFMFFSHDFFADVARCFTV